MLPCQLLFNEEGAEPRRTLVVLLGPGVPLGQVVPGSGRGLVVDLGPGVGGGHKVRPIPKGGNSFLRPRMYRWSVNLTDLGEVFQDSVQCFWYYFILKSLSKIV